MHFTVKLLIRIYIIKEKSKNSNELLRRLENVIIEYKFLSKVSEFV